MAQPNAQLYLIRHGATNLNDGPVEKFRSWSNPELNEEGIADAHTAGQFMANKGIKHIFASDLDRTMHTGEIIGQYTGAEVTPEHGLRPWNLGVYIGQPVEQNISAVQKYQEHPDKVVPGGESYNTFLHRWKSTFGHLVHASSQMGPIALITHTRNVNALEHEARGLPAGEKSALPPGGIMRVDIQGGRMKLTDLDPEEGKSDEHKPQE